jgi:thiamine-phosphate pyrophosphorylase
MPELREAHARPRLNLSVYLVTDTALCGGPDGVVDTVREAVAAGVTLVQLRDSQLDDAAFVQLGRRLVAVLADTGVPLLINDRIGLVAAIGAAGAHLGQSDLPVDQARRILGAHAIIGLSAATPAELAQALSHGREAIDYLGVGAFRATATKPEAALVGLTRLQQLAALSPWSVCAIGGVTAADAPTIAAAGAHGLAVVSAICGQPDIAAATAQLVHAWHQTRREP